MIQAMFLYKYVSVKLYFHSVVSICKLSKRVKFIWFLPNYKQNILKQYFTFVHDGLSVFIYDTVTVIMIEK